MAMQHRPVPTLRRDYRPACLAFAAALLLLLIAASPLRAEIAPFVGSYSGSAEVQRIDGTTDARDMSVEISARRKGGFHVSWTTVTHKSSGKTKSVDYSVEFLPTERDGIYSAAMEVNVFGHAVQLDPMKGEPYVWGRIAGDTLTIYSLHIDDAGGWELQQFDRTLAEGGLTLDFTAVRDGEKLRTVSTFLERH